MAINKKAFIELLNIEMKGVGFLNAFNWSARNPQTATEIKYKKIRSQSVICFLIIHRPISLRDC